MKRKSGNIKQEIMRKYLIYAAALIAAVGCNKELTDDSAPVGNVILTATVESEGTKVGASVDKDAATVAFTWSKGDAIAVQTASGYSTFTLVGDGGSASGQFSGNAAVSAGAAAIFPAVAAGTSTDVNLPAEYDYVAGQTNALLYATVDADNNMAFKHLGGLVSLKLEGVPAGAKFVLTAEGQKVNGAYSIADGQVNVAAAANEAESTVTIKFAEKADEAVVYVPLPVGEYAALKVQLQDANGAVLAQAAATQTKALGRAVLKTMPNMVVDLKDFFVTPSGAGDKSGKTWENAMGVAELRALLAQPVDAEGAQIDEEAFQKAAVLDGVSIHMAAGEYYLAGEANSFVKVEFSKYEKLVEVDFLGGYPAGLAGTSKTGRDASANVTAFTGNNEAAIIRLGNQVDLSFDGLTFKNCNFAGLDQDCAAIYAAAGGSGNCALALNDCKFLDNKNTNGRTGAGLLVDKVDATVTNCYFAGNYARNGAAINMKNAEGTATVENCTFENNSTANTSGAVQNAAKTATFKKCVFKSNVAGSWGGGAYHTGGNATATFTECEFTENSGPQAGAVSIEAATCTFNDCTFTKNSATKTSWNDDQEKTSGGAINMRNDAAVCNLNNCTFTENTAVGGQGGAISSPNGAAKLNINAGTKFLRNTAKYPGGAIFTKSVLTINGTSSSKVTFDGNNTLDTATAGANGGAIWAGGSVTMNYALFANNEAGKESGSTVNYSNGGAIYVKTKGSFLAENCEFTGGRARNGGALAIYMEGTSPAKLVSCNFHDIICLAGPNHDQTASGNFNGAACQFGAGTLEVEKSVFKNLDVKGCSSCLHVNGENCVVKLTDCEMLNNKSRNNSPSAVCIRLESKGQKLYMNRCLIQGNNGPSRGVIQFNNENAVGYLNDVTFKDNFTTNSGNAWGVCIHSAGTNICMNNVTSYNNYNTAAVAGNNTLSFNSDGGWLVVNSTIIDKTPKLLRANKSRKVVLANNIFIGTMDPQQLFVITEPNVFNDMGHNLMSCTSANTNAPVSSTTLLGQSVANLGGSYSDNWTAAHPYAVYLWSNALTGFTPATGDDVYAAIAAYTETDANVKIDASNIGLDFYEWLKSIGAVTESGGTKTFKDARGVARTGNYWPGAYQN